MPARIESVDPSLRNASVSSDKRVARKLWRRFFLEPAVWQLRADLIDKQTHSVIGLDRCCLGGCRHILYTRNRHILTTLATSQSGIEQKHEDEAKHHRQRYL
jgi:hypothetical protein